MAEHDAKTPTGVGITGTSGPMNGAANTPAASMKVAHMVGGQSFIGQVVKNGAQFYMEWPYEILVMPNPNSQSAQVTLVKHGSMLGLMPELASNRIELLGRVLSLVDPNGRLAGEYVKALQREVNPVTKEEVAALIKPGQMSGGPDA